MPEFGVNQSNALNAISKINFTNEEYFNEFIGGLSSEAKSFIKVNNNHPEIKNLISQDERIKIPEGLKSKYENTIIIYGDDNGFNEDNRKSFTMTYDSNNYGLGEHGQGCRAAYNEYMKLYMRGLQMYNENNNYFFGIISYNNEIGWTIIKITFNYEKKDFCIEYEYDNDNLIYHDFFRKNMGNSTGTMFFIPNIFNSSYIINDCLRNYKKMLNYRIFNDNLTFYFNDKIIELNHPLITNHYLSCLYRKFKILPVRARKNNDNGRKGKLCDMFRFEPDPFNETNIYHFTVPNKKPDIYKLDQVEIDTDNTNHRYMSNNFILCEICNIKKKDIFPHHEEDYNISNLAHDCGIWIYKKKILINMKPFGTITRGEGSGFSPQISFHVDNINMLKTEANKSKLTMTNINQPFSSILKFIKEEYKILYKNSLPNPSLTDNHETDNTVTDNPVTDNPVTNPPSPSRNNIPNSVKNISLYEQYQPRCIICEKLFTNKNPHEGCHIKSDKNGGTNDIKNTLIACFYCNRKMSSMNMMEWIASNWGEDHPTYNRVFNELKRLNKNIF